MLEGCHSLRDIEGRISNQLSSVTLLGQIPLTEQDFQVLSRILRSEVNNDWSRIRDDGRLSLCCYLVHTGIRDYDHGDYWSSVLNELGQTGSHWKQLWGEIFLDTLVRYKLTTFPNAGGLKFVTPILLHGGIPDNCLPNFFEYVLFAIVSGGLDTETSDAEQLVAEWRETSHYHQTNKPVRRFLEDGGKPAADLLTRCVEMARTAHYEGRILPAGELGLPERVAQQFGQWWPEYRQPMLSEQRPRLNRPWIERDLYGEVRCVLPEQTLSNCGDDAITFQVAADGQIFCQEVAIYARGSVFLTEPTECSLPPAHNYSVQLRRNLELLREWSFAGLTADGWIAFDEKGRLLRNNHLPRTPFWLIFVQELDLEASIRVIEEFPSNTVADNRWSPYSHYLIDPTETDRLILKDQNNSDIELPLTDCQEPELHGKTAPNCHAGELLVYTDVPPVIRIPIAQNEWDVIVEDLTGPTPVRKWYTLKDLMFELQQNQAVVPLSQDVLLGRPLLGEYRVWLRSHGALGRDQQFRFAFIRNLDYEFDQTYYLMHETPRLTLMTDPSVAISSEDSTIGIVREDELAVVRFNSSSHILSLNVVADNQGKLALTILVPRLRWTLRGLANHSHPGWLSQPLTAQREDFEASGEITLLVQLPVEDNTECTIELEGTQHRVRTLVRHGKARFLLRQFYDSLRSLTTPIARFTFVFTDSAGNERRICPLMIRTRWIVDRFECRETRSFSFTWHDQEHNQRQSQEQRSVTFYLEDSGRFQQRQIRLWNLLQPWEPPCQVGLPDNCSLLEISEPFSSLSAGRYRIELFTEGEFETVVPLLPPRRNDLDVFDLVIRDGELLRKLLSPATSFCDHLSCRIAGHKSSFDLSTQVLTSYDRDDLTRTLVFLIGEGKKEEIRRLWFEDLSNQIKMGVFRQSMRNWLEYFAENQDDQMKVEMLNLCKVIGLAIASLIPFQINTQVHFENRTATYQGFLKWEDLSFTGNPTDLLCLDYLNASSKIPLARLDEIKPIHPQTIRQ